MESNNISTQTEKNKKRKISNKESKTPKVPKEPKKKKIPMTQKERYQKFKKTKKTYHCDVCDIDVDYFSKSNHLVSRNHALQEYQQKFGELSKTRPNRSIKKHQN